MNRLTRTLARICRDDLIAEKWLIAPSLRTGHQWLEAIARNGRPVVNVHVKTLAATALDLAAPTMAARGVSLLSGKAGGLLVDRILQGELRGSLTYLNLVRPGANLAEVVLAGLHAVRLAGLSASDLSKESFEVPGKGEDIILILGEYEKLLRDEKRVDYADVLEMATIRLLDDPDCVGGETVFLIPADLELRALEKKLLAAVIDEKLRILPVEDLPGAPARGRRVDFHGEGGSTDRPDEDVTVRSDAELLRFLLDPSTAPGPFSDGTVRVTRAVGEVNEVRAVLRHCVEKGIPWDEVELLHTDPDVYVPLVYETLLAIERGGNGTEDTLPVTFREGIPCRYARPGRALTSWLAWVRDGFPQALLVTMVREGLLELPAGEGTYSGFSRLAGLLRGVGIGFGPDRYLPKITEQIKRIENRLSFLERAQDADIDDDEDGRRTDIGSLRRDLEDLRGLRDLVRLLLDAAPSQSASQPEIVAGARKFLETAARSVNRFDRYAKERLDRELEDMEYWLSREARETGVDVGEWLDLLVAGTSVLGSGPRPGCLHVDNVRSGGHSGRPVTFIVGLDDTRFPGRGLQDPLLLDSERQRISPRIPTAAQRLEDGIVRFAGLLARLEGEVILSFTSKNLVEDRDMFPSPVLLPVYRLLTGDPSGDLESFYNWLPQPESIAPTEPGRCLDQGEWWLNRLGGPGAPEDPEGLVNEVCPHLGRAGRAALSRADDRLTEYDGLVPEAGRDLDPTASGGPVMSASGFQTMGRCPRSFFFHYGLEIEPPEELVLDPGTWLDALNRGSLLHELFEEFLRKLIDEGRLPEFDRDHDELMRQLDDKVQEYRDVYPPPSDSVFRSELARLTDTAQIFLREEDRYFDRTGRVPAFLEASIGLRSGFHGTALDTPDPIAVVLPDGRKVKVRGRIDRIDRSGGGETPVYHIWDYKTGSSWGYSKADPFMNGKNVQPYLYLRIATDRLKSSVSPSAAVASFGFFFPGERTVGERIVWTAGELSDGAEVLGRLSAAIARGAFIATPDTEKDCKFCDYRPICGDLPSEAASSRRKLRNPGNTVLDPFRELRGIEPDKGAVRRGDEETEDDGGR